MSLFSDNYRPPYLAYLGPPGYLYLGHLSIPQKALVDATKAGYGRSNLSLNDYSVFFRRKTRPVTLTLHVDVDIDVSALTTDASGNQNGYTETGSFSGDLTFSGTLNGGTQSTGGYEDSPGPYFPLVNQYGIGNATSPGNIAPTGGSDNQTFSTTTTRVNGGVPGTPITNTTEVAGFGPFGLILGNCLVGYVPYLSANASMYVQFSSTADAAVNLYANIGANADAFSAAPAGFPGTPSVISMGTLAGVTISAQLFSFNALQSGETGKRQFTMSNATLTVG